MTMIERLVVTLGTKTDEERDVDGEHWILINWGSCDCCQSRFSENRFNATSVYRDRRENCTQSQSGSSLEVG